MIDEGGSTSSVFENVGKGDELGGTDERVRLSEGPNGCFLNLC